MGFNVPSTEELATDRTFPQWLRVLLLALGAAIAAFHIYVLGVDPMNPWHLRALHVSMMAFLILLLIPARHHGRFWVALDTLLAIFVIISAAYTIINLDQMKYRLVISPNEWDLLFAVGTVLIVLEVTRRTSGWALPIIAFSFILYALFGNSLPGVLWHQGLPFGRLAGMLYSDQGIYGLITGISSTYVILFIIFGAFLEVSGVGKFFIDTAMAIAGRYRGGPAKIGVVASMLFAGISGSAIANVVSTGNFTIPLMKSVGYSPAIAGAIEAVSSTAGNLTPPIMGPSAFIMAEILGIPYGVILVKAFIPAALYFSCLFIMVDLEAGKQQLKGMPSEELPGLGQVFRARGHLVFPIIVMLYVLIVMQASPIKAALWSIVAAIITSWLRNYTRIDAADVIKALYQGSRRTMPVAAACISAGIIVAIIASTGIGARIGNGLLIIAGESVLLSLIVTMVVCIILGMGLPSVAAYVVAQSVMAPALIQVGVAPLAAHLFIFYFAIISAITPPIALAAFAGAGIAGANPFETAWQALRFGAAAFVVPYMFVYGPALLLETDVLTTLMALVTAALGIYLLAASIQGYLLTVASYFLRLITFASALAFMMPGWQSDAVGLGVSTVVITYQWRRRRTNSDRDSRSSSRQGSVGADTR